MIAQEIMARLLLIGLFAMYANAMPVNAQARVELESFSLDNGLSDRIVREIFRDREGFLWIGTRNGLNRFDGRNFYVYDSFRPAPYHLTADDIASIAQLRNGKLVLAYHGKTDGFDLLDPSTGQLTPIQLPEQVRMHQILTTQTGDLFLIARQNQTHSLWRWNEAGSKLIQLAALPAGYPPGPAHADASGNIWITAREKNGLIGLTRYTHSGKRLPSKTLLTDREKEASSLAFFETSKGEVWLILGQTGVYIYHPKADQFLLDPTLPKDFDFLILREDLLGNILLQTLDRAGQATGLFLLEPSGRLTDYQHLLKYSPQNNVFYSSDFTSGIISGTGEGLKWLKYDPPAVFTVLSDINSGVPYGASIRGICGDGKGNILVSTERHGWYLLNPVTGLTRQLRNSGHLSLGRNFVKAADGSVWGVDNQLVQYFPETGKFKTWDLPWKVEAFTLSRSGILWLGFKGRLGTLNPADGRFEEWKDAKGATPFESILPNYLLEAKTGDIWIGTENGLFRIQPLSPNQSSAVQHPTENGLLRIEPDARAIHFFNERNGLSSSKITCISEGEDGRLWLGTISGGLNLFNPETGRVEDVLSVGNGLANASIAGILPDGKGNYWISTYGGLSYFNRKEKAFRNFYQQDGFSHDEFNRFSFFRDENSGDFYFGTIKGLNRFNPAGLFKASAPASVLLSEVTFFGQDGKSRLTNSHFQCIAKNGNLVAPFVQLPPNNRFLRVKFALADFRNPGKNQYAYRIDGLDKEWNYLGANGELIINYLPTGKHELRIKGADRHGNWSPHELTVPIEVLQHWYYRAWAWMIWGSLVLAAVFGFNRFRKRRLQLQHQFETEQREAIRLKELNTFKNRLYTNITHEFRTPLTVMLGIAKHLEKNQPTPPGKAIASDPAWKTQLKLVERNGQHLLDLVNQMLDLAKAENNTLKIKFIQGNILPFLHFVAESFSSLANQQNVLLKVESRESELVMDYAPESLRQILSNLLSNALKHTPSGGKVTVEIAKTLRSATGKTPKEQPFLLLNVRDTGQGIAPEDLPKIFDRFFSASPGEGTPFQKGVNAEQADAFGEGLQEPNGTGIGLALVKELVHLLGGTVEASSEAGQGAVFSILLPITHNALSEMPPFEGDKKPELSSPAAFAIRPSILIVEDNADVVQYLRICLEAHYRLEFAYNGQAGLEKALKSVPDIILSDVVMPGMDGFELCNTLKNDPRSSHIPIVLLTARGDVESRITGLRQGADAYLVKPFHPEELLVILNNLIQLRDKLQARYKATAIGEPVTVGSHSVEEIFLQKLRAIVAAELNNPELTMQEICRKMGMGHTNLNLKINALTGMPISLFIRKMRLHRAMELLGASELSVSEIAYETGFNDPKYFSRVFAEEYGAPPSSFRKP